MTNRKFEFKKSVGSISLMVAALMVVLALIFTIISDQYGRAAATGDVYAVSTYGLVITFCVLAFVFVGWSYVLDAMGFEGKLWSIVNDALRIVAAAFLVTCFSIMVSSRGDLMGYIWFSDLEAGNAPAVSALYMALMSWIFYVLAMVALAVSAFSDLSVSKKEDAPAQDAETSDEASDDGTVTAEEV